MKLAYWMYAGPAHIGTLRVASSFKNVHAIMHAPLGDDYFNVMRSMLERERDFTPVTASIVDRHVLARGSQEKVVENITRKDKEERPDLILLTPTCTSSILQEDLQNFVNRAMISSDVESDVILADVNHYRVNELQAADRTLEQIVRFYLEKFEKENSTIFDHMGPPSANKKVENEENVYAQIVGSSNLIERFNLDENDKNESSKIELYEGIDTEDSSTPSGDGSLAKLSNALQGSKASRAIGSKKKIKKTDQPSANIIGIFTLGFHNQHDCRELKRLLTDLGIKVNEIIPEGGSVKNLKNLPKAWFNIVPYREIGLMTAIYLEKEYQMPYVSITPMGVIDTSAFILEISNIIKQLLNEGSTEGETCQRQPEGTAFNRMPVPCESTVMASLPQPEGKHEAAIKGKGSSAAEQISCSDAAFILKYIDQQTRFVSQAAWFSRSIDCQNLTGKKAVVFGDATHAAQMTKILSREMGIRVACSGTYCKHDADWFREQVLGYCDKILITDDHTQVGDMIAQIEPAAIFGTQMERHVGKRLDIPCGVISAPVHIQNFPLGYRPFLGYEGTNQIADLVYNSFSLGMEDHLLSIFGGHDTKEVITKSLSTDSECSWSSDGLIELNKIPGFVRGKVKRNTEKYARHKNISLITIEVMYAAKEAAGA